MKIVLLFVCFVSCTLAAVVIERASRDKENEISPLIAKTSKQDIVHPGHCYTDTYNLGAFEINEKKKVPGQCAVAECWSNGDISFYSCGEIKIQKPCMVLPGNLSKPYPDCCFQIKCYFQDDTEDDEIER